MKYTWTGQILAIYQGLLRNNYCEANNPKYVSTA